MDDFFKSKRFKQAMVAAVFLLAGIIVCIVWRWDWLSGGEQGNTPSETLRNMGLLIAGVLALAFALWRAWVAEKQSATARRQADTAQLDLLNDRYQRGAQLLGNDDLSVRMAGIYSLQRLAEEDPDQYDLQVMQVFCAFVRNHTEDDESFRRRSERIIRLDKVIPEDVQTALAAVRKRCQLEQSQFKLPKFTVDLTRIHRRDKGGLVRQVTGGGVRDCRALIPVDLDGVRNVGDTKRGTLAARYGGERQEQQGGERHETQGASPAGIRQAIGQSARRV